MTLPPESVPRDISLDAACAPAALQSAVRKAALRFVPLLTIACLFNYLDRTSLGFAALTMNHALGLSAGQFGFAAGIFFLAYFLFEVPSNVIMDRVGARIWIARIMISWGVISGATAFIPQVSAWTGLSPEHTFYALRFLLGLAEAAGSAAVPAARRRNARRGSLMGPSLRRRENACRCVSHERLLRRAGEFMQRRIEKSDRGQKY